MKLDTAPIAVAATALTIPAIAPWEAEKKRLCRHCFSIKSDVKFVLSKPVNTSKNQKTWNYNMKLY